MNLKQAWDQETYYLFEDAKCWWCDRKVSKSQNEQVDCLHHILGRCSNSPLNAAPLHNFECHLGNGKLSWRETKETFLVKTLNFLIQRDYKLTRKDRNFMGEHSEFYSQ